MIFKPEALCTALYCIEITQENLSAGGKALPDAPFCVVLVSSGRAALAANGPAQLLSAGGLFLARGQESEKNAPSEIFVTPADDCHLLAVGLGGAAAQRAAQGLAEPVVSSAGACPMAAQLLAELRGAIESKLPAAQQSECAYRVLCALADADAEAPTLPPLVADAVLAIRQNYAGLYGVEELSAQLGVSKSHLVRAFSAAMGVPPGQYLTNVRIAAAKQLLSQRDYTLEVVASLCGFSGANYFCKVFKKETGISPARYRALPAGLLHAQPHETTEWEKALYI